MAQREQRCCDHWREGPSKTLNVAGSRASKEANVAAFVYQVSNGARALVPELDNVIANLELMPERMNSGKRDRVGDRQVDLARKFRRAGLLSEKGLRAVERAAGGR